MSSTTAMGMEGLEQKCQRRRNKRLSRERGKDDDEFLHWEAGAFPVARELAPARLRSSRKINERELSEEKWYWLWGRFAAQRDGAAFRQAPSPQVWGGFRIRSGRNSLLLLIEQRHGAHRVAGLQLQALSLIHI